MLAVYEALVAMVTLRGYIDDGHDAIYEPL
jgi:hypothetical protein